VRTLLACKNVGHVQEIAMKSYNETLFVLCLCMILSSKNSRNEFQKNATTGKLAFTLLKPFFPKLSESQSKSRKSLVQ